MEILLNIVVVEDHDELRQITVETLEAIGHHVIGIGCAEELVELPRALQIDLMLIDLNLPGEDGVSLARRMRQTQPNIGIIMLTARAKVSEITQGYENGADIYLTKPTTMQELSAAIVALSRRLRPSVTGTTAVQFCLQKHTLSGLMREVNLTSHEACLLAALARAPGQRIEYWQFQEILGNVHLSKANLEMHIVRLRKKLSQISVNEHSIKAIRHLGYQLTIEIQLI